MRSDDKTLIGALRVLARDIQTDDGVINACLGEAAERLEELSAPWRTADRELPGSGVAVLASVYDGSSNPLVIRAMYAAKHTLESAPDYDDDCDYDEATDTYYCKAGWYEYNSFEGVHWAVYGMVTHWTPLPNPPAR